MSEQEIDTPVEPVEPDESDPAEHEEQAPADDDEAPVDDDEAPAEPEGPVEPEQHAHGLSPEAREKAYKKVDTSFQTYVRSVSNNLEEDATDLVPCPLCTTTPHPAFLNLHDAGHVPEEIKRPVMAFLGFATEVQYPHSSAHRTCPECEGLGKVTTGSRVPGKETVGCAHCHGAGFIGPQGPVGNGHVEQSSALTGPTVFPDAVDVGEIDAWEEPRILPDGRENPNFGKMPTFKIQVEPWGTTAGLTAQDALV